MDARKKIYLAAPRMSEARYEQQFVEQVFASNWLSTVGEQIDCFEQEVAQLLRCNGTVALNSGTAAMHLALRAAGVTAGDVVLCQSLTFAASAYPIVYERAKPVFIDSETETWNMCPQALEEALRTYDNVKAVIVVHLYGIAAQMQEITRLCAQYGVTLIEDAAESFGSMYEGQYTGTFGQYGVLSFNGNKLITTAGGGMLIASDAERLTKVRYWATQAREPVLHYEHCEVGYNYRMSNVAAAIGRGQLKIVEEQIAKKRAIYMFYERALANTEVELMPCPVNQRPNCWLTAITLTHCKPQAVIETLAEHNIEARPLWKPMHEQPIFAQAPFVGGQVASDLYARGVCLPSDVNMTEADLEEVVAIVKQVLGCSVR